MKKVNSSDCAGKYCGKCVLKMTISSSKSHQLADQSSARRVFSHLSLATRTKEIYSIEFSVEIANSSCDSMKNWHTLIFHFSDNEITHSITQLSMAVENNITP